VLARHAFQLELAERAGASVLCRTSDELYRWAAALPGARAFKPTLAPRFVEGGPSLIIDTVGTARSVNDAIALAREGGRIVVVGGAARLSADWTRVWYRQLTVGGVFAYGRATFRGEDRDIYDATIDLLRAGSCDGLGIVTHRFPLDDYREAVAVALDKRTHRSTKVVLYPSG
jgi:L-iditol 2-dehydrogenase